MPKKDNVDTAPLTHGSMQLPSATVNGYSLQLRTGENFLGDSVSRRAFGETLDAWRTLVGTMHGKDPLGAKSTPDIDKDRLDALLAQDGPAASAIRAALEDYALQLSHVVHRFMRHPSWDGVQRIVFGGGFQQSAHGRRAIRRAGKLLQEKGVEVELSRLRHHADEGGLLGWVHLAPPALVRPFDGFLAVDLGGTNVRCGIVRMRAHKATDMSKADVVERDKWRHGDAPDVTRREHLVQGIADMLNRLTTRAEKDKTALAPFVGVACPGVVSEDGSITGGTQNLPGNWESAHFHLPQELGKRLLPIGGTPAQVCVHNDAVVQGLSQLPWMQDVRHWAVLTIGTGLGNASYTNRR